LATPDDMAARLRVTRRQVLRLVRTYHVPVLRPARSVVLFDQIAREALEDACRSKFADVPTRDHSKSTGEFARPARRPGSEYASALALTTKLLREKKQSRLSGKSSAGTTSASVHPFAPSPKPTRRT
jgi:hypothetical protein